MLLLRELLWKYHFVIERNASALVSPQIAKIKKDFSVNRKRIWFLSFDKDQKRWSERYASFLSTRRWVVTSFVSICNRNKSKNDQFLDSSSRSLLVHWQPQLSYSSHFLRSPYIYFYLGYIAQVILWYQDVFTRWKIWNVAVRTQSKYVSKSPITLLQVIETELLLGFDFLCYV